MELYGRIISAVFFVVAFFSDFRACPRFRHVAHFWPFGEKLFDDGLLMVNYSVVVVFFTMCLRPVLTSVVFSYDGPACLCLSADYSLFDFCGFCLRLFVIRLCAGF